MKVINRTYKYRLYPNKKKQLADRQWTCPVCGTILDRDVNAAQNILDEGIRILTSAGTVDYTGGEDVRTNLTESRSSVKPEAHESLAHR